MTNDLLYTQQNYFLYIQQVVKVEPEELTFVLINYGVSAKKIVQCLKRVQGKRVSPKIRQ